MLKRVQLAAVIVLALAALASAQGAAKPSRPSKPKLDRYQVPAGAALLLKLGTALDGGTASVDDQVEATLWSPLIQDGVELIPAESVVFGRVVEVVRASERRPSGYITFAFSIVEHAATGSRATLNTRTITIEAPRPDDSQPTGRKEKRKPVDAAMPAGASFIAVTSEPLLVRIPR